MSGCGEGKYLFLCLTNFNQPQELTCWPKFSALGFPASLLIHSLWLSCCLGQQPLHPYLPPSCWLLRDQGGRWSLYNYPCTIAAPQSPPLPALINRISAYLLTNLYLQMTHLSSVTASQRARVLRISRNRGKAYSTLSIYNAIISFKKYL